MHVLKKAVRHLAILSAIGLLSIATGCSKPADKPSTASTSGPATAQVSGSKLGDLSAFRTIAADVAGLAEHNQLPAAKARIKDLESAWDSAEAGLKPRAAADWHVLDKSLDHALDALRASSPDLSDCQAAMTDLLKAFDSMKGA
ncbi:hypothetical protein SAMN04487857_11262 [Pseudomonas sp. ok272]|uniref:hypothetical protein n=1 Tax=unclassified Pseudomonas TaxID=196821 RepID=UPI0008CA8D9E|nr:MULTISPECIES: hypothetical protein [unclassified Pseudomonas]SEN24043.1 hypothetical protein SAMN04487857_11262 [Pseudomonas sp. ok272]SFN15201.1 hypothetical protein SAMN04487858_11362 [Pseudomonas sp. ok602]